jgi:hypothetical protein
MAKQSSKGKKEQSYSEKWISTVKQYHERNRKAAERAGKAGTSKGKGKRKK